RSPIVVANASIAVTAVVPSRIAIPARSLRRRCLRKLSMSSRKNISVPSPLEHRSQLAQIRSLNHHLAAPHSRLQRNRITTTFSPHRRGIQRRSAHLARNPLVANIKTHRPADSARISYRNNRAIRLFEQQKTYLSISALAVVDMHSIAMQLIVVDVSCW